MGEIFHGQTKGYMFACDQLHAINITWTAKIYNLLQLFSHYCHKLLTKNRNKTLLLIAFKWKKDISAHSPFKHEFVIYVTLLLIKENEWSCTAKNRLKIDQAFYKKWGILVEKTECIDNAVIHPLFLFSQYSRTNAFSIYIYYSSDFIFISPCFYQLCEWAKPV